MRILILALMVCGCYGLDDSPCEAGRSICTDATHVERCIRGERIETDCAADCAGTALPVGTCETAEGLGQSGCACNP